MTVIYQLNQFFKLFLPHFLLYDGSSTEQNTFLHLLRQSLILRNLFPPSPPLPTQQGENIYGWRCPRTICILNSSYLFSIYFPFFKKNIKKIVTLDTRHGTLDPRHKNRLGRIWRKFKGFPQGQMKLHGVLIKRASVKFKFDCI